MPAWIVAQLVNCAVLVAFVAFLLRCYRMRMTRVMGGSQPAEPDPPISAGVVSGRAPE